MHRRETPSAPKVKHANSYVAPSLSKIPTTKEKRFGAVITFDEQDRQLRARIARC